MENAEFRELKDDVQILIGAVQKGFSDTVRKGEFSQLDGTEHGLDETVQRLDGTVQRLERDVQWLKSNTLTTDYFDRKQSELKRDIILKLR